MFLPTFIWGEVLCAVLPPTIAGQSCFLIDYNSGEKRQIFWVEKFTADVAERMWDSPVMTAYLFRQLSIRNRFTYLGIMNKIR